MEVHTTEDVTEVNASTTVPTWVDGPTFRKLNALRPWITTALIVVLSVGNIYLLTHDANSQQAVNLSELDRKTDLIQKTMDDRYASRNSEIKDMKSSLVTVPQFDERTKAMQRQLDILVAGQQEMLMRLPIRNP